MRALVVTIAVVSSACTTVPRSRIVAPLQAHTICLTASSGRAPVEVVADVRSRVELALASVGVVTVETGCDVRGEVAVVGGYQWVMGWYAERLTMQIRSADGKLLGTVDHAGPFGGPGYVSMLMDDFSAAVARAFQGSRDGWN